MQVQETTVDTLTKQQFPVFQINVKLLLALENSNFLHTYLLLIKIFSLLYFCQFQPSLEKIFFYISFPQQFSLFYSKTQPFLLLAPSIIYPFPFSLVINLEVSIAFILLFQVIKPPPISFYIVTLHFFLALPSIQDILLNYNMKSSKSTKLIIILFLVSGFIYTFSYKLQGSQIVHEGEDGKISKTFFHPYMQGLTFFMGQSLCAIVICYYSLEIENKSYSKTIFIIPALSDLFCVMLQCTALALISGSTFMMLKGASIVTTLIFSHLMKDIQIKSRHLIGCGLAILGLIIVGLADIILSDKPVNASSTENHKQIGYVIMITSLIFNGFLYAYEQRLLKRYNVSPIQMVGWQGIYGTAISLILVIFLSFIQCPYSGSKCVYNKQSVGYIQLPSVYLMQVFSNFGLFCLVVSGMISNAFYNFYGVTITQTLDSLTRSLLNVCRTGLIWIFGIFITLIVTQQSPYRIQSLSFDVNLVKLLGFTCIICGTLIYNKIFMTQELDQLDLQWLSKSSLDNILLDKQEDGYQMVEIKVRRESQQKQDIAIKYV